jgi:hypothetical protein
LLRAIKHIIYSLGQIFHIKRIPNRFFLGFFLFLVFVLGLSSSYAQRRPGIPNAGTFGGFGNNRPGINNTPNTQADDNAQESLKNKRKAKPKRDSLSVLIPDSLRSKENTLETTVESYSSDSTMIDVEKQLYHLYKNASVVYGDIELKADYILLDWKRNQVTAFGTPDTSKTNKTKVSGKPVFIDGDDTYNSDTIRYNFKSKRALVSNIVTQQGEGFVQGRKVKKDADDNMYLTGAKYILRPRK